MTKALLLSVGICAASAALEGILAGRGVKHRFGELRLPPFSPSLGVWVSIGLLYYAACGVVLYRLLAGGLGQSSRAFAFALLLVVMSVNATWNYIFFRRKDTRTSFFVSLPYGVLALVLARVLFQVELIAAWAFLPYAIYLGYGTWWGYRLWRLNDGRTV